jgi:hypothetical protein
MTAGPSAAFAQGRRVAHGQRPTLSIRGAATIGYERFSASDTFKAVLGTSGGPIYGGGAEAIVGRHLFVRVDATRFGRTGERVFASGGQVFRLGIPLKITVTPIVASAGYRDALSRNMSWYVGAGAGSWGYSEKSDDPAETVSFRKIGVLGLGGVEWRVRRPVALGFEGQFSGVPNALGNGGASAEFGEKDLGGASAAFRIVIGR